jgi:hypothetical protein
MILSGSFTGRRHRVAGKPPADPAKQFARALARSAFVPIDPASDKTRVLGWVNPRAILDESFTWDQVSFGRQVVLGLRIDTRRVSRAMLRARLEQALAARRREKPGARITREERGRVAQALEAEMLAQTPASTTVHELWWNVAESVVWFSSTASKANEEMQELFERTFDLRLIPMAPFTLAEAHTERTGKGGGALERAEPMDLRAR